MNTFGMNWNTGLLTPDLTNALVDKLAEIHTATHQNLMENLPRIVEAITAAHIAHGFGLGCFKKVSMAMLVNCVHPFNHFDYLLKLCVNIFKGQT